MFACCSSCSETAKHSFTEFIGTEPALSPRKVPSAARPTSTPIEAYSPRQADSQQQAVADEADAAPNAPTTSPSSGGEDSPKSPKATTDVPDRAPPVAEKHVGERGASISVPVAASPPAAPRLSEGMFQIVLTKTVEQSRIGLDVDRHGWQSLRILKIKQGLINDWNLNRASIEDKPEITAGFRIVEVNGVNQDPLKMMEAIANSTVLKITMKQQGTN
mmetsp:Transcript_55832/g.120700  ORF Transcript_55832/g.120700 Transcript_55832/m.120700 type:complete len:218 (+) Transcript_55832:71-724(+)|eukprot:CAMPEP_0170618982 /NCGR_PEP_ID=MMETSP0224-20130122/27263_1 /TAXON_ID=285029 /ORGANISM="Togula jolla, Strain CCCM 725" /LENGTH=217 /DNA_ID=CAMNT_0010945021 /DNA_START=52 /DNA_END=705 /DNA_ORIENTATION=-